MCPPPPVGGPVAVVPPPPAYPPPARVAARGEFKGREVVAKAADKENIPQKVAYTKFYHMPGVANFVGENGRKIKGGSVKTIPAETLKSRELMTTLILQKRLVKVDFDKAGYPVKFYIDELLLKAALSKGVTEMFLNKKLIPDAEVGYLHPSWQDKLADPTQLAKYMAK